MARNRKWRKLTGNGDITKWAAGVAVEGELMARRDGKFGPLLELRPDVGEKVTVGETAVLQNRLAKVEVGTYVRIECTGKAQTKSGKECWDFEVHIEDPDEDLPL